MPTLVRRLEAPSIRALSDTLAELAANGRTYACPDEWTLDVLSALPDARQVFVAEDGDAPVGVLVLVPGFVEPWGAPSDILGGNPVLPMSDDAAAIHTALLLEATAWVEREGYAGMEILLPMGAANWKRNERLDSFLESLGFARSYVTMTRALDEVPECSAGGALEIAPAAAWTLDELYANYAACTAHGEIDLIAKQTPEERRAYFDSLVDETLAHSASLALCEDDRLIGFALVADWSETESHLAWIGILPTERGRGLGRSLLCDVMAACRERGGERMSLYTDVGLAAESLYANLGFQPAGALTYRWSSAMKELATS